MVGALYASDLISGAKAQAVTSTVIALAVISGFAAFAARAMHTALAGRVDILSQALDASADAQVIIAPDGRIAYANTAFYDLFPQFPEAPLERVAAALSDPDRRPISSGCAAAPRRGHGRYRRCRCAIREA